MMQIIGGCFIRDDAISWVGQNKVHLEKRKIIHCLILKGLKISFLY